MSNTTANELAETERDARLGTGGTGVLSFCPLDNNPPHSVPVSYGYETTDPAFYFGLSAAPESAKARLLPCAVTFVVHGRTDGNWWSVVAKGELTETTQSEISTETLRGIQHTHIDFDDILSRPSKAVPFTFYRLVPAEFTTRTERSTPRE